MLDHCAPGWKRKETPHFYRVTWKAQTYSALPKGGHGKKKGRAEVEVGHIRQMIRQLGVDLDCARKYLPVLE